MADVRCPMCGKLNPEKLEECQFCGARLKPVLGLPSGNSETIKPGDEPVKRTTTDLEKVNLTRGAPIRPGEAPTKKNTAELERALPSWLRNLRNTKRPAEGESLAEPTAEESSPSPVASKPVPAKDSSEGLPDWLTGLNQAASEEEEVPDWLAGMRGGKSVESAPTPAADEELSPGLSNADWMARLGGEPQEPASQQTPANQSAGSTPTSTPAGVDDTSDWLKSFQSPSSDAQAPAAFGQSPALAGVDDSPDWLKSLQSAPTDAQPPAAFGQTPSPAGANDTPDWLKSLQSAPTDAQPPAAFGQASEPAGANDSPDWLKSLQSAPTDAQELPAAPPGGDNLPEWLSGLPGISAQSSPTPNENVPAEFAQTESMPDWLDQFKQKSSAPESGTPAAGAEPVPDWLSSFDSAAAAPAATSPAAAPAENVPDWLTNLEGKSGPTSPGTAESAFSSEPQSAGNLPSDKPSWLSQLQTDVSSAQDAAQHKDDFEVVPPAPASSKETGPLPDWLSGIEPSTPFSSNTPALIGDNKDNPPGEQSENAFSMETPDWLSKLNPEQASEKAADIAEGQPEPNNIEAAELPSWVRAMRPVESVVESKTALVDENRVAEISGPLAGLRGVLPSEPGLGMLRKPPAYSTKLQVSDGQQRYAASLERLIVDETDPRVRKATSLPSNQILRWLIALLLILAVGLPLISANTNSAQITPPTSLLPSDKGATSQIIAGLPANVPVLVVFDYDPALSGELEAVAAPIMDQLLFKKVHLALISTSPTGPILAEHFLQTTPLVKDYQQSGEQYVNLGYLAGGPLGILYFAGAPTQAVTVGVNGQPVWGTDPWQTIQKLSAFAAVVVLTDNADTGRNWIEQASPHLGSTPMLMVISAQAEPMIRPYFDSGQLKGLVSGLSEAKIYEQSNQSLGQTHQFGLDNQYWDSFSVGMLVAELIIVAGVILGVLTDWRARHKDSGVEA